MSRHQETEFGQQEGTVFMAVRTDTDNDAMQVPEGIETVVVNENAERVIIPPGVQVIRLQTPHGGGGGHARSHSPQRVSPDSPPAPVYQKMEEELARAKREAAEHPPAVHAPNLREKTLSLPSCPPTPPGHRSKGTDAPDFTPSARPPPLAPSEPDPAQPPPLATSDPYDDDETLDVKPDIFDDRTLEVDKQRVIQQQPTPANGRVVRYAGGTEAEMRDPLVAGRNAKMRHKDSFGWREEFQRGEAERSKPVIQQLGRACADILCCWLGL